MTNTDTPSEDRTILAALEALERSSDPIAGASGTDEISESDALARLYTEALGLMPFELDPVAPSPEVLTRIMALVQGDETQPAPFAVPPFAVPVAAVPAAVPTAVPSRSSHPSQEVRVPRPVQGTQSAAAARRTPGRASRWPLALAAALAFLMVGLSAWLYLQVGEQRQTIVQLEDQLAAERTRVAEMEAESRRIQSASLDAREALELVTSHAVEVSPMRPVGELPVQPQARGILFVRADHQHWYMSLEGLQPAANGQAYKLWFLTDQGAVSGGSFTAKPGTPIVLNSESMAAGTKGVLITLEADPRTAAPTGPQILQAAAVYKIS